MSSSVLLVHPPKTWRDDIGTDKAASAKEAASLIENQPYACVAIFTGQEKDGAVIDLLKLIENRKPSPQTVLVVDPKQKNLLANWLEAHTPLRVVLEQNLGDLVTALQTAIERHHLASQESDRLQLVREQNERLRALNRELETRVGKRQKSLERAKTKLLATNRQIETLHAATLSIHKARSLGELENSLTEALKLHLGVSATRIRFQSQSALTAATKGHAFHEPLVLNGVTIGELVVLRPDSSRFNEPEIDLLHQIADAVALGVDRLAKLEQAEVLKQQWQTTFDSISEPLCLTDAQFRILRTNRTFATSVRHEFRELMGKNCFEVFFDVKSADEFFSLGRTFKVRRNRWDGHHSRTFDVTVQPLKFESMDGEVVLVFFRDITARLQMERQLLESSKMAELGLIGSSIAHELNNPLGGMLSFIQLIRMDLKGGEPYNEDVLEMERAANRCRDIVQNLLGFARKGDASDKRIVDLKDILHQALRITDLQTRSQGIEMNVKTPAESLPLMAQSNQLTQAVCNLVQNSADAVLEKRRSNARSEGRISIRLTGDAKNYLMEITDTGVGIAPEVQAKIFNPLFSTKATNANSGLGLTIAYRIISEHGGSLEIASQPGVGTTARIAFPRPDLGDQPRIFDSKI